MYRHGILLGRLYLAFDRGDDWRGWIGALLRAGVAFVPMGKRILHFNVTVGPFFINLKVR